MEEIEEQDDRECDDDRGQPLKNPGKQPRGAGWQQRAGRDPPEAAVSAPHQRALNTGVLCGLVVAPDIDVPLQELADRIVHLFEERCGFTPLARIGKAPKILPVTRPNAVQQNPNA